MYFTADPLCTSIRIYIYISYYSIFWDNSFSHPFRPVHHLQTMAHCAFHHLISNGILFHQAPNSWNAQSCCAASHKKNIATRQTYLPKSNHLWSFAKKLIPLANSVSTSRCFRSSNTQRSVTKTTRRSPCDAEGKVISSILVTGWGWKWWMLVGNDETCISRA